MRRITAVLFYLLLNKLLISQTYVLSGTITDKDGPLPFATILVKGSTHGTNSNINGQYALKLPAGTYEIIYQYIGSAKKTEKVILSGDKQLDVKLAADGVELKEVVIKAGEDPAYPIIRQAIKKRRFYLNQLEAYSCNAYIKGLQKINSIPKNIEGLIKLAGGDPSDTNQIKGVVYLSESVSTYYYEAPNNEKEIMHSSKVSGDNRSFSFNKLSDMKINFYNNLIDMGDLSGHPFTSPIHENAFFFYRYYLLGAITGEGKTIHKIKVVPKRKTDPCFSGIIYIQDSTWRITSVNLMLTKDAKIDFVDTLRIKQLNASVVGDSLWMPVTLNLSFDFKILGFKGSGYFNAHVSEYELHPAFSKNFFKNELLKVEADANKKDSAYWNSIRAVPLTREEIIDYKTKDSIAEVRSTDRYKDSIDRRSNKLKVRDVLLGYSYSNTKKSFNISLPGLITDGIQYNTVEGLNLSYRLSVSKSFENFKRYIISGSSRYGFSNKLWGGELGFSYLFKPEKFSRFSVKAKSIVEQFNRREPIPQLVNSSYTLLYNENLMKIFKETGVEGSYYSELVNGIFLNSSLSYMQRDPLKNTTDRLIFDDKRVLFTSNDPQHPRTDDSAFSGNRALTAEITFSFRFKQKYYTLPHQKIIAENKYPSLSVSYKKAIPVLNADADFDLVSASVDDNFNIGLFGRFYYHVKGGSFLNTGKLYFMDFQHFLGNQTMINSHDYLHSFRLLPYYRYSADGWFTEAHAEHHFQGIIINQIPLLKKLDVQEVVGGHFLANNQLQHYYEINFGIEKIFKVIRIDYILGYTADQKLKQGITFGLNMSI